MQFCAVYGGFTRHKIASLLLLPPRLLVSPSPAAAAASPPFRSFLSSLSPACFPFSISASCSSCVPSPRSFYSIFFSSPLRIRRSGAQTPKLSRAKGSVPSFYDTSFTGFGNSIQSRLFWFGNSTRKSCRFSIGMSQWEGFSASGDSVGGELGGSGPEGIIGGTGKGKENFGDKFARGRGRGYDNRGDRVWRPRVVESNPATNPNETSSLRVSTSAEIDALGRTLTAILRHRAEEFQLPIRSDGFVEVNHILSLNFKTRTGRHLYTHTIEDVKEAVRLDNKNRFSLVKEDQKVLIRANQGHTIKSVEAEHLLKQINDPSEIPICIHGTYFRFIYSIVKNGLSKMKRNEIHFSVGLPKQNHVISGMRSNCEVLIFIDTKTAMNDGIKFYMSENNVILTQGFDGILPSKYFSKILKFPSMEELDIEKIMLSGPPGSKVL